MKKRASIFVTSSLLLLVIVAMLESGCFSALNYTGIGGPGSPSPSTTTRSKVTAGAADVVTLPVQVPFFLAAGTSNAVQKIADARYAARKNEAIEAIKKDPSVILGWNMDEGETPEHEAFVYAIQNHFPGFTDHLLREIIQRSPGQRDVVFSSSVASETFIRAAFEDEMLKDSQGQPSVISAMIKNPNMPDDLLIEIVQRSPKNIPLIFSRQAGRLASESVIRAAFEDELLKDSQRQPSAIRDMIANPNMPDDLKIEIIRRSPRNTRYLSVSEAVIRAVFNDELIKDSLGQPSLINTMIASPHMPDDLKIELIQRSSEKNRLIFSRHDASEAVIRAAFDRELRKAFLRQPSAIGDMILSPEMPEDLLLRVSETNLDYAVQARNELRKRAATKHPAEVSPATNVSPQ